jgi:hypothetical protein
MRKHGSKILGVLVVIIIVVFVFAYGFTAKQRGDKIAAEVGPMKITAGEYQDVYTRTANTYRRVYGDKFDEKAIGLKETVMNQLVNKYVLLEKAESLGLRTSDREFMEGLARMGLLDKNGQLNRDLYIEFLRRQNMEPKMFEETQKQAITIGKLVAIVEDNGAVVDEKAAYQSYLREKGQVRLAWAVFDPDQYRDKVTVDDQELGSLYDKGKSALRSENILHLKYMVIDDKSGIRDDKAYMELLKSKDLSSYGKSKGLEVVDLGPQKESDILSKFAALKIQDLLKGMGKGDISLPAREGEKSFIFQIVDREEGKPLEKSEALKILRQRLTGQKAKLMARVTAEDGTKGKGAAFTKGSEFLPRSGADIPGLGDIPKDDRAIFQLSKGQTYQKPVEMNGRYYVFTCVDEKQPENGQWEKDKGTYQAIYAARAREAYMIAFTEDLRKSLKVKINSEDF